MPGLVLSRAVTTYEPRRRLVDYVVKAGIMTTSDLALLDDYPAMTSADLETVLPAD